VAGADAEFVVHASEVGFHGLLGDEQRLCDLPVALSGCCEFCDAPLRWGQGGEAGGGRASWAVAVCFEFLGGAVGDPVRAE
jgi:hypothetical protein